MIELPICTPNCCLPSIERRQHRLPLYLMCWVSSQRYLLLKVCQKRLLKAKTSIYYAQQLLTIACAGKCQEKSNAFFVTKPGEKADSHDDEN